MKVHGKVGILTDNYIVRLYSLYFVYLSASSFSKIMQFVVWPKTIFHQPFKWKRPLKKTAVESHQIYSYNISGTFQAQSYYEQYYTTCTGIPMIHYDAMTCCFVLYHITSCHVTSHYVMSHHVMPCHITSCHATSCYITCLVTSCHIMSCHITSYHVMSHNPPKPGQQSRGWEPSVVLCALSIAIVLY